MIIFARPGHPGRAYPFPFAEKKKELTHPTKKISYIYVLVWLGIYIYVYTFKVNQNNMYI